MQKLANISFFESLGSSDGRNVVSFFNETTESCSIFNYLDFADKPVPTFGKTTKSSGTDKSKSTNTVITKKKANWKKRLRNALAILGVAGAIAGAVARDQYMQTKNAQLQQQNTQLQQEVKGLQEDIKETVTAAKSINSELMVAQDVQAAGEQSNAEIDEAFGKHSDVVEEAVQQVEQEAQNCLSRSYSAAEEARNIDNEASLSDENAQRLREESKRKAQEADEEEKRGQRLREMAQRKTNEANSLREQASIKEIQLDGLKARSDKNKKQYDDAVVRRNGNNQYLKDSLDAAIDLNAPIVGSEQSNTTLAPFFDLPAESIAEKYHK